MSDTPLTDAVDVELLSENGTTYHEYRAMREHAERMETKLAAANARVVELEAALRLIEDHHNENEGWREIAEKARKGGT